MTKTLTEQWRAGNLKNSFYYLKFPDTETAEIYNLYDMEKFRYVQDSEKIEVLDEVPSYEEYNELATKCNQLQKRLEIATKALREIRKRIEDFNDDPMNKIGFMAYGTLHECLKESKKALKEMEGSKMNNIDMCQTGYDYEQYQLNELENEHIKLKKQLEIATKALEYYTLEDAYVSCYGNPVNPNPMVARKALKEMEGVK